MVDKYTQVTSVEHVLLRPDLYVGSTRVHSFTNYVFDDEKIEQKTISYPPALIKIFNEILSNAIDNVYVSEGTKTPCTKITVSIEGNKITVWNNGCYIPIALNKKGKYLHSMVFGELYTSSNYDDTEERLGSGRNGIGAKATCIFSSFFSVKANDPENKKTFYQEWRNHMSEASEPQIKKSALKTGYTEITWIPDFSLFGLEGYTPEIISLIKKSVYDMSMITNVNVFLNNEKINITSLLDYSKLYITHENVIHHKGKTFEVIIYPSSEFKVISFVNGIYTSKGGRHVDTWTEAIFRPLVNHFNKGKSSKINIKDVKNFFMLFIKVVVINPEFESQEKNELMHPDVTATFPMKHVTQMCKWENTKRINDLLKRKDLTALEKTVGTTKREVIKGFDKANKAGTKFSSDCTLILCEGLSAKTYAVTGIEVGINGKKGRDWYGIMSLMGKVLNVRGKSPVQISKNKEITNIINVLGLKFGLDYTLDKNYKTLNYGQVMIVCDADSVAEDTPLLLKNKDGLLEVRTINDISQSGWLSLGDKEISYSDFEIWTDAGWTKIEKVIRHKVTKKMYRVLTHTGCVDVTEDHSLLKENSEIISPKDCRVGDKLLHSFPTFYVNEDFGITKEDARVMGLLWSSIPKVLLNSPKKIRKHFFKGVYNNKPIRVHGKIRAQEMYLLCKSIGYEVFIDVNEYDTYWLTVSEFKINSNTIKKIIPLEDKEQYVYDLQTHNHHFQGGVGNLCLHNTDGIHISSLLINTFHSLFPSLLDRKPSFIVSMQTPIARIFLKNENILFYNERDFSKFEKNNNMKVKYYKGLGTSSDKEVRETFGKKIVSFIKDEHTDDSMEKTFNSDFSDYRKEWMANHDDNLIGKYIGNDEGFSDITISQYLNTELIKFSLSDCERSIPNIMDGLKQSQRKILYTCFSRNLKFSGKLLKVVQLAGAVAEKTNYHHGEQCLNDTIIKMSQDFVGSNNIPLLYIDGQGGSRIANGKDAASSRYLFCKLSRFSRLLFREEDDILLEQCEDDGDLVEPIYYVPILPITLINGSAGIGTGWSSNIPCYNPLDLIKCVKLWLKKKKKLPDLTPWYNKFTGDITRDSEERYISYGVIEKKNRLVVVKELPIDMSIDKFKEQLEEMVVNKLISSFNNYSTTTSPYFEIKPTAQYPLDINTLKLYSYIRTSNMVLFTSQRKLQKFENVKSIIDHFCTVRYEFYVKRKQYMLKKYVNMLRKSNNKYRFLEEIIKGDLIVYRRDENVVIQELNDKGYDKEDNSFNYLLKMPVKNFTEQKLNALKDKIQSIESDVRELENTSEDDLWIKDLDEFEKEYI